MRYCEIVFFYEDGCGGWSVSFLLLLVLLVLVFEPRRVPQDREVCDDVDLPLDRTRVWGVVSDRLTDWLRGSFACHEQYYIPFSTALYIVLYGRNVIPSPLL